MTGISVMAFCWIFISVLLSCTAKLSRREQEADKLLKLLNKPFVRSIQSIDGDIIDCVLLYKQPAFDHPLLKNHTIQMRPSLSERGSTATKINRNGSKEEVKNKIFSSTIASQLWNLNGSCPRGTVPIRRVKKEDILRASSIESFGKKSHGIKIIRSGIIDSEISSPENHMHAIMYVRGNVLYGTQGYFNAWAPHLDSQNDMSLSQTWVVGGGNDEPLNRIEAGWQVQPSVFGDYKPRLFTYWTPDHYRTGCYNMFCSGFVQVNSKYALGVAMNPVSIYDSTQYEMKLRIFKGKQRWWLVFNDEFLGYWPCKLFFDGFPSASQVHWGGEVAGKPFTAQMGSGHFPKEGFRKACYIRDILVYDDNSGVLKDPRRAKVRVDHFATNKKCYNVGKDKYDKEGGRFFYFGGPGCAQNSNM